MSYLKVFHSDSIKRKWRFKLHSRLFKVFWFFVKSHGVKLRVITRSLNLILLFKLNLSHMHYTATVVEITPLILLVSLFNTEHKFEFLLSTSVSHSFSYFLRFLWSDRMWSFFQLLLTCLFLLLKILTTFIADLFPHSVPCNKSKLLEALPTW